MNDHSAQNQPQFSNSGANSSTPTSYLDEYLPPLPPMPQASAPVASGAPQPNSQSVADFSSALGTKPSPVVPSADFSQYTPPAPVTPQFNEPARPVASASGSSSGNESSTATESLEDQNIFDLLGVTDGTDQEKESFLDELQQVIWEDFLENDVKLLLTTEELKQLDDLVKVEAKSDLEKQEKIVVFLEKLVPDLEEIMLEKALELKADLVKERVAGMKEYFAQNQQALTTITEAEQKIAADQWRSAAQLLNGLK